MYSKTSLGARQLAGPSLSRRGKKVLGAVGALLVLALAGLGIWSVTGHGKYGASAHGCVNFTVAGSTGGSLIHYCGAAARSFCRSAYARADKISLAARPQCQAAGLTPARVSGG
jgi:predicted carbohydrate-binding protein with CBM5 and CBM33 domain